jgi:antitoxin component YwqK of YwqJK toxin-antitoxin module
MVTVTKAPKNSLLKTVLWDDLDYHHEGSELYKGKPFTGLVYDYDEGTGIQVSERSLYNGVIHGFSKYWHPSGHIKSEARHYHGGLNGELREWHENGNLKRIGVYWQSETLREKIWDDQGNLVKIYNVKDLRNHFNRIKDLKRHNILTSNLRKLASKELIKFNKKIQTHLRENPFFQINPGKF